MIYELFVLVLKGILKMRYNPSQVTFVTIKKLLVKLEDTTPCRRTTT